MTARVTFASTRTAPSGAKPRKRSRLTQLIRVTQLTADTAQAVVSGFAAAAEGLGILAEQDLPRLAQKAKEWFQRGDRCLLILDNVEQIEDVENWIPEGGHVLLTTRLLEPGRLAEPLLLKTMTPDEGAKVVFSRARVAEPTEEERTAAVELARAVEGLPLALYQAGAYMASQQVTATEYLGLYRREGAGLRKMASGDVKHASVTVTFKLAFERLGERARDVMRLCAFLAPEAIPEEILTGGREADLEFREAMGEAVKYSLVDRDRTERLV